jgi:hypothetical protein
MSRSRGRSRSCLELSFLAALALAPSAPAQEIRLGSEFLVNTETINAQSRPRVAIDASGGFVVVWQSYAQDAFDDFGVLARRFSSAGVALATEFQVNTNTVGNQYEPSIAMDADGDFVVAWESPGDGDGYGIFARRFSSAGVALATEFQVNTLVAGGQYASSAASDAAGDFIVAWHGPGDGDGLGVFARRFTSAGVALASEFQVNTLTANAQRDASLAADADGDFVVAWRSELQDGSDFAIFARRFTSAGTALAAEFQVNTYTSGRQDEPSVAIDAGGDFVVAWRGPGDGDGYGIFARRFDSAGVALPVDLRVNVFTTGLQSVPSVASDAGGGFVVAWASQLQDGSGYGVAGRRFSGAGAPLATEFQVNTHTTSSQFNAAAAMSSGGALVVAWESQVQDGSLFGVFGQRFARPIVLDVDGDGSLDALTDGLLVLRYTFGFRGATLVTGAVDLAGCTRCDAGAIESYLGGLD